MPLLERGREVAECAAAIESALQGRGGMVVIEGTAGLGKTELLRAARTHASARGARVLAARGLEVEREVAFGGMRQLLEPVFRAVAPEEAARLFSGAASPAARLFEHARSEAIPQVDPAFATLNALYWVLAGIADVEPLVVLIDDAHWLDPPSLRLLEFVGPRIEELPAVAIVATRPTPEEHDGAILGRLLAEPGSRVIRPRPLSAAAVAELVQARLGQEPDAAFVEACADATGGNPFYLSELLRELELRGVRGARDEAALVREVGPRNVSLALRFRGAGSTQEMAVARAVAVLGDGARLDDAAALAGVDVETAARAADTLVRESVFAAAPALAFAHPIVRTAIYADIGPKERAGAHARAAQLLHAAGAPIERVAAHLMRTEPALDPRVVELLRAAAAAVLAQGAPDTAVQYLRRAVAEPPNDDGARADVLFELGRAEKTLFDPQAVEHFAEAYALARDARTCAQVTLAAAPMLFVSGRRDEAVAMASTILEQLRHDDSDLALELEVELASLALYDLGVCGDVPRLGPTAEYLEADSPVARRVLCHAAFQRTWRSDDAALASELAQRGLADGLLLSERGTETPELSSAGLTLIYADRVQSARELVDAALAHARTAGARFGFAHVSGLAGELSYREGSLADAEADARMCLAITSPAGHGAGVAVGTAILIRVLIDRGALGEAVALLTDHSLADAELPPMLGFNWLLSARGRLRLAYGDRAGGMADLLECGHRNGEFGVRNPLTCPWRVELAVAHQAHGENDAARALANEELAAARGWGTPGTIGSAQRLMGLLSSGDDAIALLQEAAAALAESPARLEHARALVDLGAALRRAKRRADAREPLTRGLDLADRCGATVLGRQAREELAATGARPRRAQLTGIDALTASERRVAEMAARGRGNTEIAQTLFVTRKTVEKHLGNAYTKLGVKSRVELPTHFAD